jgi:hypothetical protein
MIVRFLWGHGVGHVYSNTRGPASSADQHPEQALPGQLKKDVSSEMYPEPGNVLGCNQGDAIDSNNPRLGTEDEEYDSDAWCDDSESDSDEENEMMDVDLSDVDILMDGVSDSDCD